MKKIITNYKGFIVSHIINFGLTTISHEEKPDVTLASFSYYHKDNYEHRANRYIDDWIKNEAKVIPHEDKPPVFVIQTEAGTQIRSSQS